MIDLMDLRKEIDRIDKEILDLFERRMEVSKGVAKYKIENNKPVFDKDREIEKIKVLKGMAKDSFSAHGVEELFQQIMAMSRKLQYKLLTEKGYEEKTKFQMVDKIFSPNARVVYQGIEGAYSHAAAKEYFKGSPKLFHVKKWKDAMEMVACKAADFAVLPIENSTAGSVYDNYDLLEAYDHYIVGEQLIKCKHVLVACPGSQISDIQTVYSHEQALRQCAPYLSEHEQWKKIQVNNTAVAAKMVADLKEKSVAAISSVHAAKLYGLTILEEKPYFSDYNSTRFIIVSGERIFTADAGKITVCFELPHQSGSLYNILSHFIYNDLNMTKIESRPVFEKSWEYRFFIDFEGNLKDGAVKNALRGIESEAKGFRVFGNY